MVFYGLIGFVSVAINFTIILLLTFMEIVTGIVFRPVKLHRIFHFVVQTPMSKVPLAVRRSLVSQFSTEFQPNFLIDADAYMVTGLVP